MVSKQAKHRLKLGFKLGLLLAFIGGYFGLAHTFGLQAQQAYSQFFGGLGMFIFGMNLMSVSLQRIAGTRLKKIITSMTKTPVLGMLTGIIVTSVIQSSSATTVMTVGFVNAGIMTLGQAIGVILGANIGTTVTAQLIAFKLTDLALPILAIGSALLFISKTRANRSWGEVILGFALLFLGMKFMGGSLKLYRDHALFKQVFIILSQNRFLGLLAGLLVTLIVQSSSATVGLTMSLMGAGAFGSDPGLALTAAIPIILGDNIGTCVTALLASVGTSDNAKRTALAHALFNVCGALLVLPFLGWYVSLMMHSSTDQMRQLANAHTFFNVGNGILFLPLVDFLRRAVLFIIPEADGHEEAATSPLHKRMLATPPIALGQAENALKNISKKVDGLFSITAGLFSTPPEDIDDFLPIQKKATRLDLQMTELLHELNQFLIWLAQKDLSEEQVRQLTSMLFLAKDLEIISSQVRKVVSIFGDQLEDGIEFPKDSQEDLAVCYTRTREVFEQINGRFFIGRVEGANVQQTLNSYAILDSTARENHLERIRQGKLAPIPGIAFLNALDQISGILKSCAHYNNHAQNRF